VPGRNLAELWQLIDAAKGTTDPKQRRLSVWVTVRPACPSLTLAQHRVVPGGNRPIAQAEEVAFCRSGLPTSTSV
jgi:hypothetical protein